MGGYRGFDPKYHSDLGLSKCMSEVLHMLGLKELMESKEMAGKVLKCGWPLFKLFKRSNTLRVICHFQFVRTQMMPSFKKQEIKNLYWLDADM